MGVEKECNVRLCLGLGVDGYIPAGREKKKNKRVACLDLWFEEEEAMDGGEDKAEGSSTKTVDEDGGEASRISDSKSNNKHTSKHDDEKEKKSNSVKKLRLTKEQSTLLEDSFKLHTTLDTAQKLSLSQKLNLRPRQVEVWFQNRRARTKLMQTAVDCEFLKKCCENLSNENRKLKEELQELRGGWKLDNQQQPHNPPFIHLPRNASLENAAVVNQKTPPTPQM